MAEVPAQTLLLVRQAAVVAAAARVAVAVVQLALHPISISRSTSQLSKASHATSQRVEI